MSQTAIVQLDWMTQIWPLRKEASPETSPRPHWSLWSRGSRPAVASSQVTPPVLAPTTTILSSRLKAQLDGTPRGIAISASILRSGRLARRTLLGWEVMTTFLRSWEAQTASTLTWRSGLSSRHAPVFRLRLWGFPLWGHRVAWLPSEPTMTCLKTLSMGWSKPLSSPPVWASHSLTFLSSPAVSASACSPCSKTSRSATCSLWPSWSTSSGASAQAGHDTHRARATRHTCTILFIAIRAPPGGRG